MTSKASPQYLRDFQLTVVNSRKGFNLNATAELIKDIKKLFVGVLVEMKSNGNRFTKMLAYKISYCEFIKNFSKNNLLFRAVAANLMKSSNFNLNCPFKQVENSKIYLQIYQMFSILQGLYKIINYNLDDAIVPNLYNFSFRTNLNFTDENGIKIVQGICLGSFLK